MTVFRKEMWEALGNTRARNQMLGALATIILLGDLVIPFTIRIYEVSMMQVLFFGLLFNIMIPMFSTADTVAGERERHTLETLLSTRLKDQSIVLGKILAIVATGLLVSTIMIVQGFTAVSLLFGRWDLFGPLLAFLPFALLATLLLTLVLTCVGLLVSMRSQTVQGAAQVTGFIAMPLLFLFIAGPSFGAFYLFDSNPGLLTRNPETAVLLVLGAATLGLLALDVIMFLVTVAAFKRPRLMPK